MESTKSSTLPLASVSVKLAMESIKVFVTFVPPLSSSLMDIVSLALLVPLTMLKKKDAIVMLVL